MVRAFECHHLVGLSHVERGAMCATTPDRELGLVWPRPRQARRGSPIRRLDGAVCVVQRVADELIYCPVGSRERSCDESGGMIPRAGLAIPRFLPLSSHASFVE